MKTIFTAVILLFIGNNLGAQTIIVNEFSNQTPKAKLLYENDKGLVYALPQDNMKCLVPKIESNMPIAKATVPGYIPNSMLRPGQKPISIIPLNKSPLTAPKEFNSQKSEITNGIPGKK